VPLLRWRWSNARSGEGFSPVVLNASFVIRPSCRTRFGISPHCAACHAERGSASLALLVMPNLFRHLFETLKHVQGDDGRNETPKQVRGDMGKKSKTPKRYRE
jgi:hypothetical protein